MIKRESMKSTNDINRLITYECHSGSFICANASSEEFLEVIKEQFKEKLDELSLSNTPRVEFIECILEKNKQAGKWYRIGFVCAMPGETINITITDINKDVEESCYKEHVSSYDKLTGLLHKDAFVKEVENVILHNGRKIDAGEYALIYFDIIRFKAINDMFGMAEGDQLLKYIADVVTKMAKPGSVLARLDSDRFLIFTHHVENELDQLVENLIDAVSQYKLPFKVSCNVGIYVTNEALLTVDAMIDRAVLAQSSIKGSYTSKYNYYKESMRKDMLGEQEISGIMGKAMEEEQFVLLYQPQYNHATGTLVGAEALVRWIHPQKGVISPGIFIPIFEKNGFITKLDLYVFEQVCYFIRRCMDRELPIVPVSSNFSRHDIFMPDFVSKLEEIRKKYDVPTEYLRIEITESVAVGGSQHTNEIIRNLHKCGYIVEMDDFGSGYSSLNVLKDIELDIIKLDMMFLSTDSGTGKGGTILSSMVRMAKWLGMPVIAEGVERIEQADFLRSIGCDYIQGYLYSRPLPEDEYVELLTKSTININAPHLDLNDKLNVSSFWDPKSQETLIFSNYVGAAAIFEYQNENVEILRVNKKYLQELGMNLTEKDLIKNDPMRFLDETNRLIYTDMLKRAIESGEEEECETWRNIGLLSSSEERFCIRSNVRMIGKSNGSYLFYATIRNVTTEKQAYIERLNNEKRFMMVSEQIKIYYWEYDVATKVMHPCFRCMRDWGLPSVLINYPESAIEMGIIPPETAPMYRDWHMQIDNGVKELEAVMPLTASNIPFRVRYTTEFDENGNPVKAYGSAALVVE